MAISPGSPPPPRIEVAAGLIFHQGRLLITQRKAGDHLGGLWEFPGGKCEPGETHAAALQRELREELAIEVTVGERLEVIEHSYPEKSVRLEFFRCRLSAGTPTPLGCAALAWVGPAELANYSFPAADTRLLKKIRQSPQLWAD